MSDEVQKQEEEVLQMGRSTWNVLTIGVGQGGGKAAFYVANKFNCKEDALYINSSSKDLESLENAANPSQVIKLGENVEGSGKDREVSERLLGVFYNTVIDRIKVQMKKKKYNFIFVVFSTSGGTGSGIGPKLTALLTSQEFLASVEDYAEDERPLVFGIALLPEISDLEGTKSLKNTLLTLDDINSCVNNPRTGYPIARYILVTNGSVPVKNSENKQSAQHLRINNMIADYLHRYLTMYGHSRLSHTDRNDRLKSLEVMGLHSFGSLTPVTTPAGTIYTTGATPFIIPEGERVRLVTYEVADSDEVNIINFFKNSGLVIDDQIAGYFDTNWRGNKGFTNIIGFHGFRNISKISERYSDRLNKILLDDAKREQENITAAKGLDNLTIVTETVKNEYGRKNAATFADILGKSGK